MDLHATTDKLSLITSSVADIASIINWLEYTKTTGVVSNIGSQRTAINTATTTDVLAVPASSTVAKKMTSATWRNKHASLTNDITLQVNENGTLREIGKWTLQPGDCLQFIEGVGFVQLAAAASGFGNILARYVRGAAGQNIGTVQPWFPTLGAVDVEAGITYRMFGWLMTTRAAGATSHTTGVGFGGTATLTAIRALGEAGEGDVVTIADSDLVGWTSAANLNIKAASTSTTEVIKFTVDGIVEINAAGTFIPQFTYSAVPGGAPTIDAYFELMKLGAGFASKGTWS